MPNSPRPSIVHVFCCCFLEPFRDKLGLYLATKTHTYDRILKIIKGKYMATKSCKICLYLVTKTHTYERILNIIKGKYLVTKTCRYLHDRFGKLRISPKCMAGKSDILSRFGYEYETTRMHRCSAFCDCCSPCAHVRA